MYAMEKVIFLDIDGVLNSHTTPVKNGKVWLLDPILVARLNRVFTSVPDAEIVLSSSWRYAEKKGVIDINRLLKEVGYTGPKIVHMTPDGEEERGHEIQAWLDEHPETKKFVILDDDDDMVHLSDKLIQTSFWGEGGIKDSDVERIVEILL